MEENNNANNQETTKTKKTNFFKKVYYSIFKIEKYGEMSAEGVPRALGYLFKITLIVAIVMSLGILYQISNVVNKGVKFLNEQVGAFEYKDGILQIEENKVINAPSSMFGTVIIDTAEKTQEEINQYLNEMPENKGILILKDRVLIKGASSNGGIATLGYKNSLQNYRINQFNQETLLELANGSETWKAYTMLFFIMIGYAMISLFLPVLFNAFLLSIFGYLATWFVKIKMRFVAIFNLAAYSLTLSILLNMIYIAVNVFVPFTIKYFQIMYVAVAAIYLIAAIMMIKSDFVKQQAELEKNILKDEEHEEKEQTEGNNENEKNKNKKDNKDNKESKKEEKDKNQENGEEPQLS